VLLKPFLHVVATVAATNNLVLMKYEKRSLARRPLFLILLHSKLIELKTLHQSKSLFVFQVLYRIKSNYSF
jgi:hypothetical protein